MNDQPTPRPDMASEVAPELTVDTQSTGYVTPVAATTAALAELQGGAAAELQTQHTSFAASGSAQDGIDAPLHAARDAADYVARMFQNMRSEDAEPATVDAGGETAATENTTVSVDSNPLSHGPSGSGSQIQTPRSAANAVTGLMDGLQVMVLGLGVSGLSMARWCSRCGAQVTVADTREAPPLLTRLQRELPAVTFVGGAFTAALWEEREMQALYCSPGLSPEETSRVAQAAEVSGALVAGELALYCDALEALRAQCEYQPKVLGVTGTNGKTTVTALTGLLVECSGVSVAVAGNIGPALLDTLSARIDSGSLPDVWVLELSSFQLDAPAAFAPTAATVLNLSQDHLDWHGDMAAYAAAKARVFGVNSLMVLNRDDPAVMAMHSAAGPAQVSPGTESSQRVRAAKPLPPLLRAFVSFGADIPRRAGDFGIETVNGMAWLVRAHEAEETRKRSARRASDAAPAEVQELFIQRLIPADALRIRGRHNAVNALAALALAQAAGCALAPMLFGLREYRGEPHRVESVAVIDGVEFFDDSKGTNVGATVAAISGLGAERSVVVILGGLGKGQDFSPLAAPVARYSRAVVLIGRDASQIQAALQTTGVPLLTADTLQSAVEIAAQRAHAGDAVLLSPACSSFDMFDNYVRRGEIFCEIVRDRAHAIGQAAEGGL